MKRRRGSKEVQQLEDEILSALGAGCSLPLQRFATVSYLPGRGRRLSACLWDSKRSAEENCEPDEVVVRVSVRMLTLYR